MNEVTVCVICDGPIRHVKRALVAPFLAKRIWNRKPFCLNLVKCEACGFMFYNPRLDDDELQRAYGGYRSKEYREMRHKSEPWYTEKFNAELASDAHYASRRAKLAPIFQQHLQEYKIKRVLDYGGDRGDLMLGLFGNAELLVYDISGATPAPGVHATSDPTTCSADLIINSNVLEHVGAPQGSGERNNGSCSPGRTGVSRSTLRNCPSEPEGLSGEWPRSHSWPPPDPRWPFM